MGDSFHGQLTAVKKGIRWPVSHISYRGLKYRTHRGHVLSDQVMDFIGSQALYSYLFIYLFITIYGLL